MTQPELTEFEARCKTVSPPSQDDPLCQALTEYWESDEYDKSWHPNPRVVSFGARLLFAVINAIWSLIMLAITIAGIGTIAMLFYLLR
jgi:hypothetical protein